MLPLLLPAVLQNKEQKPKTVTEKEIKEIIEENIHIKGVWISQKPIRQILYVRLPLLCHREKSCVSAPRGKSRATTPEMQTLPTISLEKTLEPLPSRAL